MATALISAHQPVGDLVDQLAVLRVHPHRHPEALGLDEHLAQLVSPQVAEGVHSREHVDLDRAHPLVSELRQSVAPVGLAIRVVARPAPEHEVDVGLGGDDPELVLEIGRRGHRRQRGTRHVDDHRHPARRRRPSAGREVFAMGEARVVEVDVAVDDSGEHQGAAEVDPLFVATAR